MKQIFNTKMLLLVLIIFWGAFLRLYHLSADSLWIDEGFTITQADAVYKHFVPLLDSGQYMSRDLLLPYVLAFLKYCGIASVTDFRLVSVLLGVLCIPLAYKIGKEIFDKNAGLMLAFFVSLSYWQIAWSRQVRSYIMFEFLFLLVLYFLIQYHRTQKKKFLLLFFLSTALAILAKIAAAFILLSLLIYFLFQKKLKSATILGLAIGAVILGGFFYFHGHFAFSLNNYIGYYTIGYFWLYLGIFFPLAIVGYLAVQKDSFWRSIHFFLLTFFLANLFFFSFFYYINQRRYLFIGLPIIFLYSAGLLGIFTKERKHLVLATLFSISLLLWVDAFSVKSLLIFPQKNFPLEDYTPQPNFQAAYQFLGQSMKPGDSLISPYPYMDDIYLGYSSYALDINYTGKENDSSITEGHKEYYSGTPEISSIGRIGLLREQGDVYILLDTMAESRSNQKIVGYIWENFPSGTTFLSPSSSDRITVYRLPAIKE